MDTKWIFMEADWVGSSPALAPDLNLILAGLEFGLLKKRGGIVALDLDTGKKRWEYITAEYVHSSPSYFAPGGLVAVGGNDKTCYLFRARDGELLWSYKTEGEIKASFAFDEKRNALFFGSLDGHLYGMDLKRGKPIFKYPTLDGIYSTPLLCRNRIIFSSLDKRVYGLNLDTRELDWTFDARSRVFSSPALIEGNVFIGANNGCMYEIHPDTGELLNFFQATERITNKIAYNQFSKRFFVPTFANEIYCIKRKAVTSESNQITV